ncbi:MAG: hypothetical protein WDO16_15785 [Bacteroidota bacterium]
MAKPDAELEKDARDKAKKAMDRIFDRLRFKFNDDDKFNVFVNAHYDYNGSSLRIFPACRQKIF